MTAREDTGSNTEYDAGRYEQARGRDHGTTDAPSYAEAERDHVLNQLEDQKRAQEQADEWNREHPIGTPVVAIPGSLEDGAKIATRTRSLAWVIGGVACVAVKGYPGGIALSHITLREFS